MGVTGLHPQLKEIQVKIQLLKYKGQTLAVDTYGWLHKAIVSCSQELCLNQPTKKYISSVTKKVEMLRYFGVEPYLVFDGASLPTKAATNLERRLKREEAQKKANEFMRSGNKKLAWKEFMKAAGVTSQMAKSVMIEMDRLNVKYVVAPFEADPQMVYLEKIGVVDGILSEDSDLLIFGCRRLISKLNDFGECIEICRDDFHKVKTITGLENFTQEQLRLVAMLSGCDYTKGIPGVGIKTAFNLVKKYNDITRVLMALRAEGKTPPPTFQDEFIKADLAFQYQKVYNPQTKTLETLYDYPEDFSIDMEVVESCCGYSLDNETQTKIARGIIHPNTHEQLVSREQDLNSLKSKSVTNGAVKPSTMNKSNSFPRNTIDNFFNVKATTIKKTTVTSTTVENVVMKKVEVISTEPTSPKVKLSPQAKRVKTHELPIETPKLNTSKFFDSTVSLPTPLSQIPDITEDSDIPEGSSPFKETKIDTKNLLDDLTDDDEDLNDSMANISQKEKTIKKTQDSSDFDLDEEDEEIAESPVKAKLNRSPIKIDSKHFLGDQTQLRKILRETFLYNSSTNKKFEMPSIFKNQPDLNASNSSLSSTSSLDLKSDDIATIENEITEPPKVDIKTSIRSSTLARFAFNG